MTFHMLWVIALGLSMDAFAVSISKGLAMRAFRWKQALAIACCFWAIPRHHACDRLCCRTAI